MADFDPFDFVGEFGPIQNRGSGQFAFKRAGRDLGDFFKLTGYGTVRATGDTVILQLNREVKALNVAVKRDAKRLDVVRKIADGAKRVADKALNTARSVGTGLRSSLSRNGRLGRIGEESARAGFLQMGRSGFTITGDGMRAVGGKAFTAGIGINVVGGGLNQLANAQDSIREALRNGASRSEIPGIAAARVSGGIVQLGAQLSGADALARGVMRAAGLSAEDSEREINKFYFAASHTREEIERRRAAQQKVVNDALAQVQQVIEADVARLNIYQPVSFRVRDRFDGMRYREDLRRANQETLDAKRGYLETEVRKQARVALGE